MKLRRWLNWYPPMWGAGIKVTYLASDFTSCEVRLKLRWWNKNYVGTQYGGSLYSMTDPFYMLLLVKLMPAKDYIIWDKAATIRFRKPGRGDVFARFEVSPERVVEMRREVEAAGGKKDFTFHVQVKDKAGQLIAEVEKVIYVRKKNSGGKTESGEIPTRKHDL